MTTLINPIEGGIVKKGSVPPSDITKLWFDTLSEEIFFYDTVQSKWLSDQVHSIVFNDNGSTGNGVFLKIGNTQTNLNEGYPLTTRMNAFAFSYTNIRELSNQSYVFYRNSTSIIDEDIPVSKIGLQTFTPVTIEPGGTLSCQHLGATNQDTIVDLKYRKEYVDFLLVLSRITNEGSGNFTLEVNFIGSDIQYINNIEWNFEEPFSGPDPISNPVSLIEQSSGIWTLPNSNFDGNPVGEDYDVTLTFTGTGGYSRQESVTVTIQ